MQTLSPTDKLSTLSDKSLDVATALLDWLTRIGEQGSNLVETQTPLFVAELMNWLFYKSLITFTGAIILWLLLTLVWTVSLYILRRCYKKNNGWSSEGIPEIPCIFVAVITFIASIPTMQFHVIPTSENLVKSIVAPRVYLAEWTINETKKLR